MMRLLVLLALVYDTLGGTKVFIEYYKFDDCGAVGGTKNQYLIEFRTFLDGSTSTSCDECWMPSDYYNRGYIEASNTICPATTAPSSFRYFSEIRYCQGNPAATCANAECCDSHTCLWDPLPAATPTFMPTMEC
eukprot:Hpha_TRINITY_DN32792_c0_g1::TRINITY_DN32792_c0_g1_i1::g.69279::m.69279